LLSECTSPANNKQETVSNFADVIDTGNTCFASVNDTGTASFAGVDAGEAPSEFLTG
jgi:hypothetical protein